jgi:hypothetical protein
VFLCGRSSVGLLPARVPNLVKDDDARLLAGAGCLRRRAIGRSAGWSTSRNCLSCCPGGTTSCGSRRWCTQGDSCAGIPLCAGLVHERHRCSSAPEWATRGESDDVVTLRQGGPDPISWGPDRSVSDARASERRRRVIAERDPEGDASGEEGRAKERWADGDPEGQPGKRAGSGGDRDLVLTGQDQEHGDGAPGRTGVVRRVTSVRRDVSGQI